MGAKGIIGVVQRLMPQPATTTLRANSREYNEADVHRAVRKLSKAMRQRAAQLDALTAARWSYLVETTLEEMEREAAAEHRLLELRIALLQVQPACRDFLGEIRHVAMDTRGDEALRLLKHAVAWRRVFGNQRVNALQAILDLASMGAALRSQVETSGGESLYVATAHDLDGMRWNRRDTALEPSDVYLGSGFSTGGRRQHRGLRRGAGIPLAISDTPPPASDRLEIDLRGVRQVSELPPPALPEPDVASVAAVAIEPTAVAGIEVGRATDVAGLDLAERDIDNDGPAPPAAPSLPARPSSHTPSYPHRSTPHHLAMEPLRLAHVVHPDVAVPPSAQRPLLRRMAARMDGIGDPSGAATHRRVALPKSAVAPFQLPGAGLVPPETTQQVPLFPPDLPSAHDQVQRALRTAFTDMNRFSIPQQRGPVAPPETPSPPRRPGPNTPNGHGAPRGRHGPRLPHRGI